MPPFRGLGRTSARTRLEVQRFFPKLCSPCRRACPKHLSIRSVRPRSTRCRDLAGDGADRKNERVLILEPGRAERNYWSDLWHYRELFAILAWRDVAVRYKQTVIGVAWALVRPFLTMVVFTIVFGRLAKLAERRRRALSGPGVCRHAAVVLVLHAFSARRPTAWSATPT